MGPKSWCTKNGPTRCSLLSISCFPTMITLVWGEGGPGGTPRTETCGVQVTESKHPSAQENPRRGTTGAFRPCSDKRLDPLRTYSNTPCVTVRLVVAPLRGPGQSPVLPFACCVGLLHFVGRCGRCSCWCRFRVRGAQWLVRWGCAECGGMCRLRVSGAQ